MHVNLLRSQTMPSGMLCNPFKYCAQETSTYVPMMKTVSQI